MDYERIKTLALNYADRTDADVVNNMDGFIEIVESRINKALQVRQQFRRAAIVTVAEQEYYGLPSDFLELRDIEVKTELNSTDRTTPEYLSPLQMNNLIKSGNTSACAYAIIADQIQLWPISEDKVFEIVYAARVPPLNESYPENWLSRVSPDTYVFGLLVEISAYVKDAEAGQLWDSRFVAELNSLTQQDAVARWSGTTLKVRLG